MRFAIIGSRYFSNSNFMDKILDPYRELGNMDEIVSGGAKGADLLAKQYAEKHNIKYTEFPALWNQYGKSAGYKRNIQIVDHSDMIIAFLMKGMENKGTNHTISIGQDKSKEIVIVEYDELEDIG